jgi:hypothetical protein
VERFERDGSARHRCSKKVKISKRTHLPFPQNIASERHKKYASGEFYKNEPIFEANEANAQQVHAGAPPEKCCGPSGEGKRKRATQIPSVLPTAL